MLFVIPFADDIQYLIKAGWKPAVRIAGILPALYKKQTEVGIRY